MKSIVAFVLLGALAFVAVQAGNDDTQGLVGFPVINLNWIDWKIRINQIVKTFNEYAGSTEAYTAKEVNDLIKVTGIITAVYKNGGFKLRDCVYLDRFGSLYSIIGQEIKGVTGIIGGGVNGFFNTGDSVLKKINQGFENGEACLSSLPNDLWVIGKASFDNVATIAADTAKIIVKREEDVWTEAVPLKQAHEDDVAKLVNSGIWLRLKYEASE